MCVIFYFFCMHALRSSDPNRCKQNIFPSDLAQKTKAMEANGSRLSSNEHFGKGEIKLCSESSIGPDAKALQANATLLQRGCWHTDAPGTVITVMLLRNAK